MKNPEQKPLTDNPRTKQVKTYRLLSNLPLEELYSLEKNIYEDYQQNDSESIQELESDQTN